jgi:hypothetical protein
LSQAPSPFTLVSFLDKVSFFAQVDWDLL